MIYNNNIINKCVLKEEHSRWNKPYDLKTKRKRKNNNR